MDAVETGRLSPKRRRTQGERRQEAERKILEAAIRLISRHGFAKITLAEVGEEAGYSRALPAHYYGAKDNLLLAVAAHILNEFRAYADRGADIQPDEPRVNRKLRAWVRAVRRNPDIARSLVMIYTEALHNEALAARLRPLVQESLQGLSGDLAVAPGAVQAASPDDVAVAAAVILAFLRGAQNLSALDPSFPLERSVEMVQSMIKARIGPQKTPRPY